jgi:hypothetical protein
MVLLLTLAVPALAAPARLLVVSGIGGAEEYAQAFDQWSREMMDAARDRLGIAAGNAVWLCEEPRRAPGRCAGESRREAVLAALGRLAREAPEGAPLMLLLIGHGTARDGRALFNLPGPDLSAQDLDAALDAVGERPLAVVNTSPASAPFVDVLSRRGRVVITATAHAAEDDHTRFAGHFVAAWAGSAADRDKDGRVSLLEAFRFASEQVGREYAGRQQLVTEHAMLDDNGDGRGSREASADAGDGAAAAGFHLAALPASVTESPARMALELQARALVEQVAMLRRQRAAMAPEAYRRTLEGLLVALALNRRAAREAGT